MSIKQELRRKWDNAGQDVVVLHQLPRSPVCPNPSPYPIKLETFLRMADIKYITDFEEPMSSKKKTPWITFNGYDIADSQICMEHLAKALNKDLSAHLTPEEQAVARGMRSILEDNFYYCIAMERWVFDNAREVFEYKDLIFGELPVPKFLETPYLLIGRMFMKRQCEGQGIGRHTKDEIREMGLRDLKDISTFLGNKPFLMGDKPTEVDCVLFGFVSGIMAMSTEANFYHGKIKSEMTNLIQHCELMKQNFWPDWEDCKYKKP